MFYYSRGYILWAVKYTKATATIDSTILGVMSLGHLIRPQDITEDPLFDRGYQQHLSDQYRHFPGYNSQLPIVVDPNTAVLPQGGHHVYGNRIPLGAHGIGQHPHMPIPVHSGPEVPWPPQVSHPQGGQIRVSHSPQPHPADARHAPQALLSIRDSQAKAMPMFSNPHTISDPNMYKTLDSQTGSQVTLPGPRTAPQVVSTQGIKISVEDHKSAMQDIGKRADDLQKQLEILAHEKEIISQTADHHMNMHSKIQKKLTEIQQLHGGAVEELKHYRQEHATNNAEVAKLGSKISQLHSRCGQLAAEAETCKEKEKQHKELFVQQSHELESKNIEIRRLRAENENLQREVANIKKGLEELNRLQGVNHDLSRELQRLGALLSQQARKMHTIHEGDKTKDQEIHRLEEVIHQIQEQTNAQINEIHDQAGLKIAQNATSTEKIRREAQAQIEEANRNAAKTVEQVQGEAEQIIRKNETEIAKLRSELSLRASQDHPPRFSAQQVAAAAGAAASISSRGGPSSAAAAAAARAAVAAAAAASGGATSSGGRGIQHSTVFPKADDTLWKSNGIIGNHYTDGVVNYTKLQNFYAMKLLEERQAAEKQYGPQRTWLMGRQKLPPEQERIRIKNNEDQARHNALERLKSIQIGIPENVQQSIINSTRSCFLIPPNFNDTASDHGGLYVSRSSSAD